MISDVISGDAKQFDPGDNKTFSVTGRVRSPVVFGLEDLRAMEIEEIEDLLLICGDGDPKGHIKSCRGVLIENVIRMAEVIKEEHDDTKKMFLVASADDGYKVVFSWQEIFNTVVGGGVMVVLERDGEPLDRTQGCFDLISAEDYFTGARYVKGLRNIEVVLVR